MPTNPKPKGKVVVAMSGGVDSAVAAALLQQQGYDCIGVFMRLGNDPDESPTCQTEPPAPQTRHSAISTQHLSHQGCCSASDATDARYVAGLLNIPFYALNFQHDFSGIIDYFVREYNAGRTPNPCVRCNEYLKFGKLARYAQAIGADFVATGHYARIAQTTDGPHLLRGKDISKDQSYVLFGVPRDELSRMLLPIGDLEKSAVRQLALDLNLPVHNKPDSQEICFVPDNDYAALVQRKSPNTVRPGPLVTPDGKTVGTHSGHQHFTIGQRKGVGVAFGYPIYVTHIDASTNTVTLGQKSDLLHSALIAHQVNWLAGNPAGPTNPLRCMAKIRYNSPPAPATALLLAPDTLSVRFDQPLAAITPGQAVVCYSQTAPPNQRLLGGAWIESVLDTTT